MFVCAEANVTGRALLRFSRDPHNCTRTNRQSPREWSRRFGSGRIVHVIIITRNGCRSKQDDRFNANKAAKVVQ